MRKPYENCAKAMRKLYEVLCEMLTKTCQNNDLTTPKNMNTMLQRKKSLSVLKKPSRYATIIEEGLARVGTLLKLLDGLVQTTEQC